MSEKKPLSLPSLSNRQIKYLKGLAHDLSAVIQIGKEGLSDRLVDATELELQRHELIKVKIGNNSSVEKSTAGATLSEATASVVVQTIGKTLVLYRPNPKRAKEERIQLPRNAK